VYSRRKGETKESAHARLAVPRKALFAALQNPDARVRAGASRAIGYLGKDAVPEPIAALGDASPLVRFQASRAL
jgi:HEAT repeat protein